MFSGQVGGGLGVPGAVVGGAGAAGGGAGGGPDVHAIDPRNRITITLNKSSFVGGEVVVGTANLECMVPFFANGVKVQLKGFDRAMWEEKYKEKMEDGQYVDRIRLHKESHEFFRQVIPVYNQRGTVAPGKYTFPFQYQLPVNLPSTFVEEGETWGGGKAYKALVLYKVKAWIDVPFKHDCKCTERLVVSEKMEPGATPSFAENSKHFVTANGSLKARVWLDKAAYFPGETVAIKLEANNTSVKKTNRVTVQVVRELELNPENKRFLKKFKVYDSSHPGFDPCFFGEKYIPFPIPTSSLPSTSASDIVKHSYVIIVSVAVARATDLLVKLPVVVQPPVFLFKSVPHQPTVREMPPDTNFRPSWQGDKDNGICAKCSIHFGVFKRRHHCRHCARIYCGLCTQKRVTIPNLGYFSPVRVCDDCYPIALEGGQTPNAAAAAAAATQISFTPLAAPVAQMGDLSLNSSSVSPAPASAAAPNNTWQNGGMSFATMNVNRQTSVASTNTSSYGSRASSTVPNYEAGKPVDDDDSFLD